MGPSGGPPHKPRHASESEARFDCRQRPNDRRNAGPASQRPLAPSVTSPQIWINGPARSEIRVRKLARTLGLSGSAARARRTRRSRAALSGSGALSIGSAQAHCSDLDSVVIPGYTQVVKTAISLPDATYTAATRRAAELGMSRSEFFAVAARRYLDELDSRSTTAQINDALNDVGADDSAAAAAVAGRDRLAAQDDW